MTRGIKITVWTGGIVLCGLVVFAAYALSRPMHDEWYAHDRAKEHIYVLSDVLEQYHAQHGHYPSTDQGLEPLVADGYLRKIPTDPWGNAYHYVCPGLHNRGGYDLWSNGADGREGGIDLDKDVNNWPGA